MASTIHGWQELEQGPPPANKPERMMAACWCMVFITECAIITRIWIRQTHVGRLSMSDYVTMTSGFIILLYGGLFTWYLSFWFRSRERKNTGRNIGPYKEFSLDEWEMEVFLRLNTSLLLYFYLLIWIAKASFVTQYLELRKYMRKSLRWLTYTTAVYTLLSWIGASLTSLLWCQPMDRFWKPTDHCFSQNRDTLLVFFNLHISTDVLILAIPLVLMVQLNLSCRDRLGLLFIIFLGLIGMAVGMARFIYLYTLLRKGWNPDYSLRAQLLGCIEMTIGFTATCLPSIRILWRANKQYYKRRVSQSSESTRSSGSTFDSVVTLRTDDDVEAWCREAAQYRENVGDRREVNPRRS